jgi:hypothetical protein
MRRETGLGILEQREIECQVWQRLDARLRRLNGPRILDDFAGNCGKAKTVEGL